MWKSSIGRLRAVGMLEAASFLLLLGVAMPLKYVWGMPLYVRVVGAVHGVLFLLFCYLLASAWQEHDWKLRRVAGLLFAALVPFGPFLVDRRLAREQAEAAQRPLV